MALICAATFHKFFATLSNNMLFRTVQVLVVCDISLSGGRLKKCSSSTRSELRCCLNMASALCIGHNAFLRMPIAERHGIR
jgi:hypothetical protein